MQEKMRAIEYGNYGPWSVLETRIVPKPVPVNGEVLIKIYACSINPIDTIIRSGILKFRTGKIFPKRTGIDFVGEVVESTSDADFVVGDRVWGVMPLSVERGIGQGSAAEFITISSNRIAHAPRKIDAIQAAAVSSVGAVAIITLIDKANLKPGERLLVRGAAGGVGTMAVQLGRRLGAQVTALASAGDLDFLKDLGAHQAFDHRATALSSIGKFDVILDLVGSELPSFRSLLTQNGRMFCLIPKSFNALLYIALSRVFGSKRVRFFSAQPSRGSMTTLAAYVDAGYLLPVVHSIYEFEKMPDAHHSIEAGGGRGKRVVNIAEAAELVASSTR